jgi:DNA repair photolyase
MPVLPGLTDRPGDLEALARAASDAGAGWFLASVLFLMPSSRKQFFPFLQEKFPRLAQRYRDWYERAVYAPENYRREIGERVAYLRKKYGLGARPETASRPECAPARQLALAI